MHTQRRYATCFCMSKNNNNNKRCIPKEGMPHASAYQKKERRKNSPLSKKKEKERDGAYKGVHTPSTKNIHTLAHLDQGL